MDKRKREGSSSPASASGTKKHAVSSNPLVKVSTGDSSTKKKNAVASASKGGKMKEVVASDVAKAGKMKEVVASGGKMKEVVSSGGKMKEVVASDGGKKDDTNSDEDPPEEIFQKHSFKGGRKRNKFAKNSHQCPDLNDMFEWTGKERREYGNWLWYESGRRGLSREEEDYLQTFGVNEPTGRKKSFRH